MHKKLLARIKPILKPLLIFSLVLTLVFSHADGALAARSGGRVGGGSFRAPSRTYSPPSRTYQPGGGYYYPGGGFGFPFILPFFGFGGGGLFTLLVFFAIAGFLVRSFRSFQAGGGTGLSYDGAPSTVSVARLQVGLLAQARELQTDLNRIAQTADTSSPEGLTQVLQESTLALLRHPEYWVYGGSDTKVQGSLESAEAVFNRLAIAERSKFSEETLTNVNNQLRQAAQRQALAEAGGKLAQLDAQSPGEYIVVTLLVATQGKLQLPAVNSSQDLRQALSQVASVSSDNLLAVEVLWTPQAEGDTLSSDDVVVGYPDLKLV